MSDNLNVVDSPGASTVIGNLQQYSSSIEDEGLIVDEAISTVLSLPKVVTEVASMQKGQNSEIERLHAHLKKLQVRFLFIVIYNVNYRYLLRSIYKKSI